MIEKYRIIAITPSDDRGLLSIIYKGIEKCGIIDQWHIWVNTENKNYISSMIALAREKKEFIKLVRLSVKPEGEKTLSEFYSYCRDAKTIYIQINADICYLDADSIKSLIEYRIKNPEPLLVSANTLNSEQSLDILKNKGIFTGNESRDEIHSQIITDINSGNGEKYNFAPVKPPFGDQLPPIFCWFGKDFSKFNVDPASKPDRVQYFMSDLPDETGRQNLVLGSSIAVQALFDSQESLEKYIDEYCKVEIKTDKIETPDIPDINNIQIVDNSEIPLPFMKEHEIKAFEHVLDRFKLPVDVLEWGSGTSTIYYSRLIPPGSVWHCIEHDEKWYEEVAEKLKKFGLQNVQLNHVPNNMEFPYGTDGDAESFRDYIFHPVSLNKRFDMVIVDGRARAECLKIGSILMKEGGLLALHDAQRIQYHKGIPAGMAILIIENPDMQLEGKNIQLFFLSDDIDLLRRISAELESELPENILINVYNNYSEYLSQPAETEIDNLPEINATEDHETEVDKKLTFDDIIFEPEIKLYAGDIPDDDNYQGLIGLSEHKSDPRHILHDITNSMPLEDRSVDLYLAEDIFGRLDYQALHPVINEIWRVLKPGGVLRISVPDYRCQLIIDRCEKDENGNIIFDPAGGGTKENPGYKWFPLYETLEPILKKTMFGREGSIEFLHSYLPDGTFITKNIDYSKGYILRTPDHDDRVKNPYRPMSIVVDLVKSADTDSEEKQMLIREGERLMNEGYPKDAERLLTYSLLDNPDDVEINTALDRVMEFIKSREITEEETLRDVRLSVVMIVLNGMPFVEYALKSVYNIAHEIIIVEGAVENCMDFADPQGASVDGTVELLENFDDPDSKIQLIRGSWPEKMQMQNKALESASGNYIFLVDSDEVYRKSDLEKILELLHENPDISQVNFIPDNFWKGFDYIFESPRFRDPGAQYRRIFKFEPGAKFIDHRPPKMLLPNGRTTEDGKIIDGSETRELGIIPCHYSYVTKNQVQQKISLYKQYGWDKLWATDLDKWMNDFYMKWTPENRAELEKEYGPWTGDKNSYTRIFDGSHPEVMLDFIKNFNSVDEPQNSNIETKKTDEKLAIEVIGSAKYQQAALDAWDYIELDEPLLRRRDTIRENIRDGVKFWNVHVGLAYLTRILKPESYLEIGVRTGGSFVQALNGVNIETAYALDMWSGQYAGMPNTMEFTKKQIEGFFSKTNSKTNLKMIQGNSHLVLKKFKDEGLKFDLINVDGDHSAEGALEDLRDAYELLNEKGAIIFDDIIHPSHGYLLDTAHQFLEEFPELKLIINSSQDNGTAIFLKNMLPDEILGNKYEANDTLQKQEKPKVKIAGQDEVEKDLTAVGKESEFGSAIHSLFKEIRPKKIIETGTYLGTGTTTIIAGSIKRIGIENAAFLSIEVNPLHIRHAYFNLQNNGLIENVKLLHGLSVPRRMLPTMQEIKDRTVENIEFEDIFVDHKEHERAMNYYRETNFSDVPDDILGKSLAQFQNKPDFVLLDSAGHIGYVEFQYLIQLLEGPCYIALDDIYHIKHHKSFLEMKSDPRFEIIVDSKEKFGFCIAKFNPEYGDKGSKKKNRLLYIRPDSIGDAVLSASMLPEFRAKFGDHDIIAVCDNKLTDFYKACPYIDEVISFDGLLLQADDNYRVEFINKLKELEADIALHPVYSRTEHGDAMVLGSNAKETVAIEGDTSNMPYDVLLKNNGRYSKIIPSPGEYKNEIQRHQDFLSGLGIEKTELKPRIWLNKEEINYTDSLFAENGLAPEKTIALFAGAQFDVRLYKEYGKAISQICKERGLSIITLGSESDYKINQQCIDDAGVRAINLSGKTTILQAAAIIKKCRAAIGAETGLAHVACAVGTPNAILLGGGHFGRFMPYSGLTTIAAAPVECFSCNWECFYQTPYCVKDIPKSLIESAFKRTLDNKNERPLILTADREEWNKKHSSPKLIDLKEYSLFENIDVEEISFSRDKIIDNPPDNEIKVSAIISTYNSEKFIKGCLENLCEQSIFDSSELIVIDSGSEENEKEIVMEFRSRCPNIKYIRTESRESLYTAWNRAVKYARGKYLINTNTDDRLRNDAFEVLSNILDRNSDLGLVYADSLITDIENETFGNNSAKLKYAWPDFNIGTALSTSLFGSNPMWRREAHLTVGLFDEELEVAGDYDLFIRIAHRFGAAHLKENLSLFLKRDDSLSGKDNALKTAKELRYIMSRFRKEIPLTDIYPGRDRFKEDKTALAAALWDLGNLCMLSPYRDFPMALDMFKKALNLQGLTPDFRSRLVKMFYNNAGIISFCSGDIKQAQELWKRSMTLPETTENIKYLQQNTSGQFHAPINFAVSLLLHDVVKESRKARAFVIENNELIAIETEQEFSDVYTGPSGIPIAEPEENEIPSNPAVIIPAGKGKVKKRNEKHPAILFTMFGWNESGGGTLHPRSLARYFAARGYDVAVFFAGLKHPKVKEQYFFEESNDSGVHLFGVYNRPVDMTDELNPAREIKDEKIVSLFESTLERFEPDIVHFHNFLGLSFAIADVAEAKGIPTVYTPHNYHFIDPLLYMFNNDMRKWKNTDFFANSPLAKVFPEREELYRQRFDKARELINEKLNITLAISTRVKELLSEFGANKNKMAVVHQIPDNMSALISSKNELKAQHHPARFGFFGTVIPHKGIHKIIGAAKRVDPENTEFIIHGFASQIYKNELLKLYNSENIKWTGPYHRREMASLGNELDAVIVPSIWEEGAGLVILEALSLGLPVIGAEIGGIPDFIEHDRNGFLYDHNSEQELANIIRGLANNPGGIEDISRQIIIPYDYEYYAGHLLGIYKSLCDKNLRPGKANLIFKDELNKRPGQERLF